MKIPNPRRPQGNDEQTKFMQWVWDKLAKALKFVDSPTIRWEDSAHGMVAHAQLPKSSVAAGGMNFRGAWSLDGRYNLNDVVYIDDFQIFTPDGLTVSDQAVRRWFFIWTGPNNSNTQQQPGIIVGLPDKFNLADALANNLTTEDWMYVSVIILGESRGISTFVRYTAADGSQRFMTFENGFLIGDEAGFPIGG